MDKQKKMDDFILTGRCVSHGSGSASNHEAIDVPVILLSLSARILILMFRKTDFLHYSTSSVPLSKLLSVISLSYRMLPHAFIEHPQPPLFKSIAVFCTLKQNETNEPQRADVSVPPPPP